MSEDLTAALRRSETEKPVVLRRGIYESDLAHMLGFNGNFSMVKSHWDEINSGDYAAEDKGFLSTSPDPYGGFSDDVEYIIKVPKGAQAMYVDLMSKHQGEKELLINAGSKFVIKDIELNDVGNRIKKVFMEML